MNYQLGEGLWLRYRLRDGERTEVRLGRFEVNELDFKLYDQEGNLTMEGDGSMLQSWCVFDFENKPVRFNCRHEDYADYFVAAP